MKTKSLSRSAAVVAVLAVILAGCSSTPSSPLARFDEEQTAEDALPEAAGDHLSVDATSVRFLWSDDDLSAYAVLSEDGLPCLVMFSERQPSGIEGCGAQLPTVMTIGGRTQYALVGDRDSDVELLNGSGGWQKLADNFYRD
ncbi:hypothetical protein [Naasia lichenicola]|uniref:Lipoprotein n=1 Tax=Naasia lichenicola TaxID=2565933 RepID=A0A4S4FI61_9MICO|nr:hypothetical protein [Naasia lichenicola]THG29738.1 hypothetical protein E6C64_13810 [Naasia lichenicola]